MGVTENELSLSDELFDNLVVWTSGIGRTINTAECREKSDEIMARFEQAIALELNKARIGEIEYLIANQRDIGKLVPLEILIDRLAALQKEVES